MPKLRERKNIAVKQAFFDAAMRLFRTKGFEATTVDEIAEKAGYSRATYFNHFGTKRGVLRFFGERLQELVEASLTNADPALSPIDQLSDLLHTMATEADAHTEDLKLVYVHSRADAEYMTQPTAARTRVFEIVMHLVTEGQRDGQIRTDIDSKSLAFHILSVYQGAVLASIAGYERAGTVMDTGWTFILNGVQGGNSLAA